MKRAIIVHCWDGSSTYAWYQSVARELEAKGYKVVVPNMPDSAHPRRDAWVPFLSNVIGQPDQELVLIGHSIGTVTIMHYLETLPSHHMIDKAIFVAGFTDALGFKELENFFEHPLDFKKIKPRAKNGFVAIQSDNDPYVAPHYGERLKDELGAVLVIKHNAGHMSGKADEEAACLDLPEVAAAI